MGKRSVNAFITLLLSAVGLIDALFLTVVHYRGNVSDICSAGASGCAGVLGSDYATLGPIPTSLIGALMYLALIVLCVVRVKQLRLLRDAETEAALVYASAGAPVEEEDAPIAAPPPDATPAIRTALSKLDMGVWLLAAAGFGIAWWLQYVAIFQIEAICPYCLTSAFIITLIFILASLDYLVVGRTIGGEQKMLAGVSGFILVMLGVMFYPQLADQINKIILRGRVVQEVPGRFLQALARPNLYWKGNAGAPYMLVEFADYMCPACKRAAEHMDELLNSQPGKFRFAFRDLPLTMIKDHKWSEQAAEAAADAGAQGKFWEMHDLLYLRQNEMEKADFNPNSFADWAGTVGCDVKKFKADFDAKKYDRQIQQDRDFAIHAGLTSTPTFIIASKKKLWKCVGLDALRKTVGNPQDPLWKE